jgi:protease I
MTRAVILVERGFQDEEYVYAYYRMLEEGWQVEVATPGKANMPGKFGVPARATMDLGELNATTGWDAVVLPGGFENPDRLRMIPAVQTFVREQFEAGKLIAAICHAPSILISAGVAKGMKMTGYWSIKEDIKNAGAEYFDQPVVTDRNMVTSPHYKFNGDFMKAVVHWKPNPRWSDAAHGSNF